MSSYGGSSRVSIPHHLRKTIQSIREITGKQHSDEDIFAVYKDSFNDPHETAQKLLFLDTFHEVRSKKDKRKENIVPVTQASGRSGRRNFVSSNTYQGNGRSASFKKENGGNHVTGGSRTALPATNKARNITVPSEIKVSGPTSLPSEEVSNHKVQDDPSVISDSRCRSQSDQVTEIETASNLGKTQSLLKSDVSERSHVTFPFHLQDAKVLQNGLTFGSFDSIFVKEASCNNGASGRDDSNCESAHGTGDNEGESSPTTNGIPGVASAREEASTVSEDKDYGISNSAPGAELVVHSDHIVPPVEEVPKEEALSNTETHQIAYGQEAPLSMFGFAPSMSALGQPVNTQAAETQPGYSNAPAIPLVSYPPDQGSIAAASQQANLYRQQYPPNFFPYGPYYSPYYMPPPFIHQFVGPNGIPQQSYFPPGAALTAPSHVQPVGNTENPSPTNPTLHASPTVATHIPSAAALNSIHSEENASSLTESAAAWIGQGFGNLQVNPMYNLALQGQPLGFPVVQGGHGGLMGIHQPTQPMTAASTTYQTLPQAPHTTTAMTEPIGHPHITYQQHQAALMNWVNNY